MEDYYRRVIVRAKTTGEPINYSGSSVTPPLLHKLLDYYIHDSQDEVSKENLLAVLRWFLKDGADPRVEHEGVSLLQKAHDSKAEGFHALLSRYSILKPKPARWSLEGSGLVKQQSWPPPPEPTQDTILKRN